MKKNTVVTKKIWVNFTYKRDEK